MFIHSDGKLIKQKSADGLSDNRLNVTHLHKPSTRNDHSLAYLVFHYRWIFYEKIIVSERDGSFLVLLLSKQW